MQKDHFRLTCVAEVAPFCGLRVPLGVVLFLTFHVREGVPILRSVRAGETFLLPKDLLIQIKSFKYANNLVYVTVASSWPFFVSSRNAPLHTTNVTKVLIVQRTAE